MNGVPKVFISVGGAPTPKQAEASDSIFRSLELAGLSPRQMKKNEWSSEQPLRAIRKVMEECHGVVVIVFSRYTFPQGTERQKDGTDVPISDVHLPTVWNQIEAAMGYMRGVPLLLIAEHGIRKEGLLEQYDWQVYWTDFDREDIASEAFAGFLASWKRLVLDHADATANAAEAIADDLSTMPLSKLVGLFGRLSAPQFWTLCSAIFAFLIAVATVSFSIGAEKWPWQ